MLVHGVSTGQELVEVVVADVEGDGQTNGTPDGVTATDPRLETEHVLAVNAELGDLGLVGREGDEVLSDVRLILGGLEEPLLSGVGVGGGFGGGEGLGGDQEEGGLGVRVLEGFGNMSTVNVGDEVQLHVGVTVGLEGLSNHNGAAIDQISFRLKSHMKRDTGTYRSEPPIPMLMMVSIFLPV